MERNDLLSMLPFKSSIWTWLEQHPKQKAFEIRDDLAFFQAIKARFAKFDESNRKKSNEEIETAIRQIINDAIISKEVLMFLMLLELQNLQLKFLMMSF
jgi:type I restriction enzyme R subunit